VVLGKSLALKAWREDAFGQQVRPLTLRAQPADAVIVEGQRLRFVKPGVVVVEALDGPPGAAQAAEVVSSQTIRVDAGPPIVRVISPKRGAVVSSEARAQVVIQGHVEEDGPTVHLTVNGQAVALDKNGIFEYAFKPEQDGLQVLSYRATDELAQVASGSHALLYGTPRTPGQRMRGVSRVFLPTALIDDDDTDLNDLARAAELMLASLSVPDTTLSLGCGGKLELRRVRWKPVNVNMKPRAGELVVGVELRDLSVDVKGKACVCAWGASVGCASFDGRVSTPLVGATARAKIGGTSATSVEVKDVEMSIAPLSIHWNLWSGALDWFVELFESSVRDLLKAAVREALSGRVQADVGALLDHVMPSQRLHLPPPLGTEVEIKAHLEQLEATAEGLRFDLGLSIESARVGVAPASDQTLKVSGPLPALPRDRLGVAVALDVLNDAAFHLYRQGVFSEVVIDWDALNLVPPPGLGALRLSATLPPLLTPGARPGELALSMGDLRLHATTSLGAVEVFISFIMPVRVHYAQAEEAVVLTLLGDGFSLHFAPSSVSDAQTLSASLIDLEGIARDAIVRALSNRSLRLNIPVIDLSPMQEAIPAFKGQQIGLRDADLTITPTGHILVTTRVEGVHTPAP
jgi:hypothetical protein